MKLLVLADVHGRRDAVERALEQQPDCRTVLFLGDGLRDMEDIEECHPERVFAMVPGNCDFSALLPVTRLEIYEGKRVLMTHGHRYHVKYGLTTVCLAAEERQADILLFGHTHQTLQEYRDGLYILNPGSLGYGGTYGLVEITPAGIMTNIVQLH